MQIHQLLLATLKTLSSRIEESSGSVDMSLLRHLSRSILSFIGTWHWLLTDFSISLFSHIWQNLTFLRDTVNGPYFRQKHELSTLTAPGLPQHPYHAFLSGAIGGYVVWGRYSGVNYQLLLYLASRIIVGSIKLASEKGIPPFSWKSLSFPKAYPLAAAGIWGTVMMLFEEYPGVLHPSLRRSMDEIYRYTSFGGGERGRKRWKKNRCICRNTLLKLWPDTAISTKAQCERKHNQCAQACYVIHSRASDHRGTALYSSAESSIDLLTKTATPTHLPIYHL